MHSLTIPILRRLSDGEFHSGEVLATHFGVSRASIWHALKGVEELGVLLYKVRGRGYQLPFPIEWLDVQGIMRHLAQHATPLSIQVCDVVNSTNAVLMQQTETAEAKTCLVAEMQTQGRGRRGRIWHAPLGGALTFSLRWQFNLGAAQLSGLSLAVGVALVRALREVGVSQVQLKWPNDLMINFQKLGGILVELQGDALGPSTTVVGVGLNIRLGNAVRDRIDQAVTDLSSFQYEGSRNQLLAVVLSHLTQVMQEFERHGFTNMADEWQQYHAYHDRPVVIRQADGSQIDGVVKGIAPDGCLILQTARGDQRFGSGEVSLRARHTSVCAV